jgi:hypothetical protein
LTDDGEESGEEYEDEPSKLSATERKRLSDMVVKAKKKKKVQQTKSKGTTQRSRGTTKSTSSGSAKEKTTKSTSSGSIKEKTEKESKKRKSSIDPESTKESKKTKQHRRKPRRTRKVTDGIGADDPPLEEDATKVAIVEFPAAFGDMTASVNTPGCCYCGTVQSHSP